MPPAVCRRRTLKRPFSFYSKRNYHGFVHGTVRTALSLSKAFLFFFFFSPSVLVERFRNATHARSGQDRALSGSFAPRDVRGANAQRSTGKRKLVLHEPRKSGSTFFRHPLATFFHGTLLRNRCADTPGSAAWSYTYADHVQWRYFFFFFCVGSSELALISWNYFEVAVVTETDPVSQSRHKRAYKRYEMKYVSKLVNLLTGCLWVFFFGYGKSTQVGTGCSEVCQICY